jgi:hypothetical protein
MMRASCVSPPMPVPARLRDLAADIRRIGCGLRADPETIAIAKDSIARQLQAIARELESAR